MRTAEMNLRLATITALQMARIREMYGRGALNHEIRTTTKATVKQINAVIEFAKRAKRESRAVTALVRRRFPERYDVPAALQFTPTPVARLHADGEFHLEKPFAFTRVGEFNMPVGPGVRIYKESPERVTLQIRTAGRIGTSRGAQCRTAYSHVSLDGNDIAAIVAELLRLQATLS